MGAEYFKLFHNEQVSFNRIKEESPDMVHAVEQLLKHEVIVGQMTLPLDESGSDIILWSAKGGEGQ